jgi:hypothetical protein
MKSGRRKEDGGRRTGIALTLLGLVCAAHGVSAGRLRAQGASARGVDTVTVVQRVLVAGDVTPAEAKRQAIERALADAVRRVSGVRVQSTQLGVGEDRGGRVRDSFLSVVQLDAAGRATDYRIVDERFVNERHSALGAQLYYELRALVTVAAERGAVDPGFTVAMTLNDALFFDAGRGLEGNDEVIATITSSQPAWLTVFGVTGDSAQVLLPNAFMTDGRALAGRPVELPPREWRDRGVHFRASLQPQEKSRHELLMVVATRSPVAFPTAPSPGDGAASPAIALMAIQRWLVTIPLDQRAMAFAAYEVRRK